MPPAAQAQGLGKRYLLGEGIGAYGSLRDTLAAVLARGRRAPREELWALRDVDLEIAEGEALGVVGRNGAGKSTLLRVLAGITAPTTGVARTRGRVAALLEVGTGFHAELTGRENVLLGGTLLGMSRREVRTRFDEIVAFAGVERFLDTPLKRYATGMHLRLAFAVAAHLEPDIVLVDEVLAVGDHEFQRRCLGKVSELERQGRTIVFVSHDLGAVVSVCSRAVRLEEGRLTDEGQPEAVIRRYLAQSSTQRQLEGEPSAARPAVLLDVLLLDSDRAALDYLPRDLPLRIRLVIERDRPDRVFDAAVWILDQRGNRVLDEAWSDRAAPVKDELGTTVALTVTVPPLLPAGEYVLGVWLGDAYEQWVDAEVLHFSVGALPQDRAESLRRERVVQPDCTWEVTPG